MISDIEVILTWAEVYNAANNGILRQISARQKHRYDDTNRPDDADLWGENAEGAGAELAYAKWCGKYWSGTIGEVNRRDVDGVEIRQTELSYGCLILKKKDHDELPYVLVTGKMPEMHLRGWVYGHEAKQEKFWTEKNGRNGKPNGRPAYFVPQSILRPMPPVELA